MNALNISSIGGIIGIAETGNARILLYNTNTPVSHLRPVRQSQQLLVDGCIALRSKVMAGRKDITGQRFGRLVAIERLGFVRIGAPEKQQTKTIWRFRCDCGNEVVRKSANAIRGDTLSCGCLKTENTKRLNLKNRKPKGESSFNGLFHTYQKGAENRGFSWELTREQFEKFLNGDCYYCGLPPTAEYKSHRQSNGSYKYNGLDRVDNSKGYTLDNVVSCCGTCNRAKNSTPVTDFLNWVKRLARHQGMRDE